MADQDLRLTAEELLRQHFLDRLVPAGLDPRANLGGRPGVDVGDLTDGHAGQLLSALDWFLATADLP